MVTVREVYTSPALLIGARCKQCGKTRSYGEVRGDEAEGYTCLKCLDGHYHALQVLAGAIPIGCQECGVTFEELKARSTSSVKMIVVMKDGIYQVLCKPCEAIYAPRCGFYRGTAYESMNKLRGYR